MNDFQSSSHVRWDCSYHIVICPKYRKRRIYWSYKQALWEILNQLLKELKVEKLAWHLSVDHVHLQISIPPALSVARVVRTLKGKSAIRLHNKYAKRPTQTTNKHFWSRWYFVRTTWLDQEMINGYIAHQEHHDQLEDGNQMDMHL